MEILQTERLIFRTWKVEDLAFANELWGDSDVMAFLNVDGSLDSNQVHEKLKNEISNQDKNNIQYWAVFEKATSDFIGCCGLQPWNYSFRSGPELGFHIIKNKWGQGFATEAARGSVIYAFETLGCSQLMVGHHPKNVNSKKVLMRLKFDFVEDVFFEATGLMHPSYELRRSDINTHSQ